MMVVILSKMPGTILWEHSYLTININRSFLMKPRNTKHKYLIRLIWERVAANKNILSYVSISNIHASAGISKYISNQTSNAGKSSI